MSVQSPSDYSGPFADHLRELGLEPTLVGALAAATYRRTQRFTTDVDFMVPDLRDAATRLEAEGYEVRVMAEPGGEPYLLFVRGKGIKVDIQLAETDYHREALRRAVNGVLSIEDVIVSKLIAWRPRDQDDISSILSADRKLDHAYIERWVEEWEVSDRWAKARARFGPDG